jgi:hypothetical protein
MKNNQTIDKIQAIWNMVGGEEMVDALIQGRAKLEVKLIQILNWLGTTTTSATTEKFVAKEKFVKDSKEVKFYGIWDNFTNWFLADDGKIEDPISEQMLRYGNLTTSSVDGLIIEELGGEAKAETTLSELYDLLKKQAKGEAGEAGDLLTNGYANIFYIKDTSSVLRAVGVDWFVVGWSVSAFSVENSFDWNAGGRVFSRNS